MNIVTATDRYEQWLAGHITGSLVIQDLDLKHRLMADATNPFPFFRGTYYRWCQHWCSAAGPLATTPKVLAVGDLHVENFGTWRDAEGRLCWGVNDFDEADELPYTHDLVRLATSVRAARAAKVMGVKTEEACMAILKGYSESLAVGGKPFVLEEHQSHLRALAMSAEREPARFWDKISSLPSAEPPEEAKSVLTATLPATGLNVEYRARPGAGVGSLGRPRYVALAQWAGGFVCREAKATAPPATAWAAGATTRPRSAEAVSRAERAHDPFYLPGERWIIRRLGPHSSRVELGPLNNADALRLLREMGAEVANMHLGTPGVARAITADLAARPGGWLADSARVFSKLIEQDWTDWRLSLPGEEVIRKEPGRDST